MYKLNHVQTTLRGELEEEKRDGKVHPNVDVDISNNFSMRDKDKKEHKKNNKKYYTINGFCDKKDIFKVDAEMIDQNLSNEFIGAFIDKKK